MPSTLSRITHLVSFVALAALLAAMTVVGAPPAAAAPTEIVTISDASAYEDAEPGVITFTVTRTLVNNVTTAQFNWSTSNGGGGGEPATGGTDYTTVAAQVLSFGPNEATKTIQVSITEDTTLEPDETFTVTLTPLDGTTCGDCTGVGTIRTDEAVLSVDNQVVNESAAGASGTTTMTFTVSLSPASAATVTVSVRTENASAVSPADFTAAGPTTLTFDPGETSQTFSVTVKGDLLDEATESFLVKLSSPTNAAIADDTGTGTINDDDATPTASIAVQRIGTEAGPQTAQFVVTLSAVSGRDVTVEYDTANGTATAGQDYTAATDATLTIPAGQTSAVIDVTVTDDPTDEFDETFTVTISNPTNATIGTATATGTIADNDNPPVVSFDDITVGPVEEGDGSSTVNVQLSVSIPIASGKTVTVDYTTADGTATAPADYTAVPTTTITFSPGQTTKTFNVTVKGDDLSEGNETFKVLLSDPENATLNPAMDEATVTITDDEDLPTLSIGDRTSIPEGNSGSTLATFTVSLSHASDTATTFSFATGPSPTAPVATANADYTATSGNGTIPAGATSTTVSIPILGDTVDEANEKFAVNVSNVSANATLSDGQAIGTIADDDAGPEISVADKQTVEGASGTTQLVFTVTLSESTQQTVTVDYSTSDGSAVAPGDYVTESGEVTFSPGQTSQTFSITVNGDTVPESDETFNVTLSNASLGTIDDGEAVGTITNDDAGAKATLSIAGATAAEDADLTFTITRSGNTTEAVTFDATTHDGTASAGSDYTAKTQTITIAAGATSATFTVEGLGDSVYEGTEQFTVTLSNIRNATATTGTATGTITDDEPVPTISFAPGAVTVAENQAGGATATFTLVLSGPAEDPVTVQRVTVNETATGGSDFNALTSGTATFEPGETETTVSVTVINDALHEDNETFKLQLSNPSSNATIAGSGSKQATITDADPAPSMSIADSSVQEVDTGGTSQLVLTVSLSAPSGKTATVHWATSPLTASAGTDYQTASGDLTFDPGVTSQNVVVTIIGDNADEDDETLRVTLSAPAGATLADPQGTGTILDEDQLVQLSINDVVVTEGSSTTTAATFTVSLSAAAPDAVTVTVATDNGTATAGSDYVAKTETLTFLPSETTKSFVVTVSPDVVDEATEVFNVRLSNASPNATISDSAGTGSITDDDAGPTMSIGDAQVTEGNAGPVAATLTVTLSAASQQAISADVTTAPGTAGASDFGAFAGGVTFAPGETQKTVSVNVQGDTTDEADETFEVRLSNVRPDGSVGDGVGVVRILDDDVASGAAPPPPAGGGSTSGYVLAGSDGAVYAFGGVQHRGDLVGQQLNQPVIGLTLTPSGNGYWLVAKDGGIFTFGDAGFFGSTGSMKLNAPVLGMEATPTGRGYWLFGQDGGIFTFGDAGFFGSTGSMKLNAPVIGMETTATGNGYWLVAQDGGIFTFGAAPFHGSTGSMKLNQPVFDMAAVADGSGYWLVARDGGIFSFPPARPFFGSAVGATTAPVVGMRDTPSGNGYWIADAGGAVFVFGDARSFGDLRGRALAAPIVGFAALQ